MKTPIRRLFTFGAETAIHMFNKLGYLEPMWIGVNEKGSHIPLLISDMSDKDRVAEMVRAFLKRQRINRYVSMLECWTYEGKKIPREVLEGKSIKDHPDRREAVNILAEDNEGNVLSGRFYILRPEKGKPKLSALKMSPADTKNEGRFIGMFD